MVVAARAACGGTREQLAALVCGKGGKPRPCTRDGEATFLLNAQSKFPLECAECGKTAADAGVSKLRLCVRALCAQVGGWTGSTTRGRAPTHLLLFPPHRFQVRGMPRPLILQQGVPAAAVAGAQGGVQGREGSGSSGSSGGGSDQEDGGQEGMKRGIYREVEGKIGRIRGDLYVN